MVYTFEQILKKYKTRYNLEKAILSNQIYKLEKDIYSDYPIADPLIIYSLKYPNAVITMDSALYFYNLTDVIPEKIYLATLNNSRPIKNDNICQIYVSKENLEQGKIQVELNGNMINIYNKERLLIEFIRKRNSIPFDYYKEVINNYRKIVEDLDMYKIDEYLSLYKYDVSIANILQREVF